MSRVSLVRPGVALLAALTALAGFVSSVRRVDGTGLAVAWWTFILAGGALAFNQVQERRIDACMKRTRARPLPTGVLPVSTARVVSLIMVVAGLAGIALAAGPVPAGWGALALALYNGIYTPLKQRTVFAGLAGSLTGALIPAVGFTAGGGQLMNRELIALAVFFALWQIPHVWLLLLSGPDEYGRAGLVPPMRGLGGRQVGRIVAVWLFAVAGVAAVFPAYGLLHHPVLYASCLFAGAWMIWGYIRALRSPEEGGAGSLRAFRATNIFAFVIVLAVIVDGVVGG